MVRGAGRDPAKERFWRRMIKRWRRSQLTVRDFCAQEQLAEALFYGWRRTIAARDRQAKPVPAAAPSQALATFLPVRVVPATASAIEVVLDNGRVLRLGNGFDPDLLRQLLAVLEEPRC
jgi:transposase